MFNNHHNEPTDNSEELLPHFSRSNPRTSNIHVVPSGDEGREMTTNN
jgi:hypothetical protein